MLSLQNIWIYNTKLILFFLHCKLRIFSIIYVLRISFAIRINRKIVITTPRYFPPTVTRLDFFRRGIRNLSHRIRINVLVLVINVALSSLFTIKMLFENNIVCRLVCVCACHYIGTILLSLSIHPFLYESLSIICMSVSHRCNFYYYTLCHIIIIIILVVVMTSVRFLNVCDNMLSYAW